MTTEFSTFIERLNKELLDPVLSEPIGQKIKEQDMTEKKGLLSVLKGKTYRLKFQPGYFMGQEAKAQVLEQIEQIAQQEGLQHLQVDWVDGVKTHRVQGGLKPLKNVKNIIVVASGKGGVGKSTTSANLALALHAYGTRVGVLDADVYGPSQPLILGIHGKPEIKEHSILPQESYGLYVNSIGFLMDDDSPAVLRGPMVAQAVEQLLMHTTWPDLDYLVVDMPPGTGDIALTISQKAPVVGAVIVTTPQDIALLDVRRGVNMFQKVHVPVLGVIENMSVHVCPCCGFAEHIFGKGGGRKMADELGVPWLGDLPLTLAVREHADAGKPTVVAEPDSPAAQFYKTLAYRLAYNIAQMPLDHSGAFPKVVVETAV